uniref:Uncharacterized protein n=1 Tax=Arundo donax TaxID=35708 RepID=A0A0A9D2U4_ARUDO
MCARIVSMYALCCGSRVVKSMSMILLSSDILLASASSANFQLLSLDHHLLPLDGLGLLPPCHLVKLLIHFEFFPCGEHLLHHSFKHHNVSSFSCLLLLLFSSRRPHLLVEPSLELDFVDSLLRHHLHRCHQTLHSHHLSLERTRTCLNASFEALNYCSFPSISH